MGTVGGGRNNGSNGSQTVVSSDSDQLQSIWNDPQLYPQMFPWLFPYSHGGIGAASLSHKEHKRHLLMYHDKQFQVDVNFPFVTFSHKQMVANTLQSFLLMDQRHFEEISNCLMHIDWTTLNNLMQCLEAGEHISNQTDSEKECF